MHSRRRAAAVTFRCDSPQANSALRLRLGQKTRAARTAAARLTALEDSVERLGRRLEAAERERDELRAQANHRAAGQEKEEGKAGAETAGVAAGVAGEGGGVTATAGRKRKADSAAS